MNGCRLCGVVDEVVTKARAENVTILGYLCSNCKSLDHFHRAQLELLDDIREKLGELCKLVKTYR